MQVLRSLNQAFPHLYTAVFLRTLRPSTTRIQLITSVRNTGFRTRCFNLYRFSTSETVYCVL